MGEKEFWHESLTEESWKKLQDLSKEFQVIVIGGWAVWLWTKQHKSKDSEKYFGIKYRDFLKKKKRLFEEIKKSKIKQRIRPKN